MPEAGARKREATEKDGRCEAKCCRVMLLPERPLQTVRLLAVQPEIDWYTAPRLTRAYAATACMMN